MRSRDCKRVHWLSLLFVGFAAAFIATLPTERAHCSSGTSGSLNGVDVFEANALFLAQGSTDNAILDETFIDMLIVALKKIVSVNPDMKGLLEGSRRRYEEIANNGLSVTLQDGLAAQSFERGEVAELNRTYGAAMSCVQSQPVYCKLHFRRNLDFLALIRIYERCAGVTRAYPFRQSRIIDFPPQPYLKSKRAKPSWLSEFLYTSDGDQVFLVQKGPLFHFVLKRGRGDCPAGCTENTYYYFTYDSNSQNATAEAVLRPGDDTDGVYLWGIPVRHHLWPFKSFDDLNARIRTGPWWVSVHALDVLGFLLAGREASPFGEDSRASASLPEEVRIRRREGLTALVSSLRNTDEDVKAVAHEYLMVISGKDFGRDIGATDKWSSWLSGEFE